MFIIVYIFVVQLTTKLIFGFYLMFNVFYEKLKMEKIEMD